MRVKYSFGFLLFICCTQSQAYQSHTIPDVKIKMSKQASLTSGPHTIIDQQQLQNANSLSAALQNLGALQLHDVTGTGSRVAINMRGFGANANSNTLLLINGIPITNPDMMPADLNVIPIDQIAFIEIISGSESVLYGDQAVGGAINILTKQINKESADVACTFGSYQLTHCFAAFNHIKQNTNFNTYFGSQFTDNYRQHNYFEQQLLTGQISHTYAQGDLQFIYRLINEKMQYPGALTHAQVFQDRRQASNSTDFFQDWNGHFQLQLQHDLNANWHLQADLVRREMHGHGVLFSPFTQSRLAYFLRPQIEGKSDDKRILAGLDLQKDHYHLNSPFGTTDNLQYKYGVFGLANFPIYAPLFLSVGARGAQQNTNLNDINHTNRAIATTLGITYPLSPHSEMYLRRAENFRFPKADENTDADGALRTQRGVSYESGFTMHQQSSLAKFEIYQLNLRDEIAFDPIQTPQNPFGSNRNLDPTIRRGFTLSGKTDVIDRWSIDGQYNYVNAKFQNGINSGKRIPLVAENIIRTGLNYQFAERWRAYAEAIYTSNQYSDNDDANIAGRLGGYTIYNFNINYRIKNLMAALHINNIFNKYYYLYTVFQSSMNTEFFYPAPGRNFVVTVKYLFD
jgi:iron complex outermembrane recepter protein